MGGNAYLITWLRPNEAAFMKYVFQPVLATFVVLKRQPVMFVIEKCVQHDLGTTFEGAAPFVEALRSLVITVSRRDTQPLSFSKGKEKKNIHDRRHRHSSSPSEAHPDKRNSRLPAEPQLRHDLVSPKGWPVSRPIARMLE